MPTSRFFAPRPGTMPLTLPPQSTNLLSASSRSTSKSSPHVEYGHRPWAPLLLVEEIIDPYREESDVQSRAPRKLSAARWGGGASPGPPAPSARCRRTRRRTGVETLGVLHLQLPYHRSRPESGAFLRSGEQRASPAEGAEHHVVGQIHICPPDPWPSRVPPARRRGDALSPNDAQRVLVRSALPLPTSSSYL
jgi:hypothetical protein